MTTIKHIAGWFGACALSVAAAGLAQAKDSVPLTLEEELGKSLFFDKSLSINNNLACAGCHAPTVGWTGPRRQINLTGSVYEGSVSGRFGNRKPPSAAYAPQAPIFHMLVEDGEALFIGGNFWDGRATGEKLGNPAADQAQGPFLNPLEQGLADSACVVWKACQQNYSWMLRAKVPGACDVAWPSRIRQQCKAGEQISLSSVDQAQVSSTYDAIALAIAAYEASSEVSAYTSKFDAVLGGQAAFSPLEQAGYDVFTTNGQCANCHVVEGVDGKPPMLTDFTFDNLGVPRNPDNPWYTQPFNPDGSAWIDTGLGGFIAQRAEYQVFADESMGKQKVPTLRNVDKRPNRSFVKAYMHNGYFKSLEGVVDFYNTRDVKPACDDPLTPEADARAQGCWPAPEVAANVNADELGNLGLTAYQQRALVAFMKTLSDGWMSAQ